MKRIPVAALAIVLTGFGSGCGPIWRPSTDATPDAPHEDMPAFASVWLTAEPRVATNAVTVELRTADGSFSQTETFEPGVEVRALFGVSDGPYRLTGLDGTCSAEIGLAPQRESDAVIRLDRDEGCELAVVRQHGEEITHEASGTLDARVTAEPGGILLVDVVSLDEPRMPVPDPVPPDEGQLAIVGPLWPGRYDVRLLRDGVPIEVTEITIDKRDPAGDLVELTLDGRPD